MGDTHGFLTRRGFIRLLGGSAAAAALAGRTERANAFGLGDLFGSRPQPRHVSPYVTSNQDFYLVAVNPSFRPSVKPGSVQGNWQLEMVGLSGEVQRHDWRSLMNQANRTVFKTFECIGNSVGGDLISNARWHVIPLKTLLSKLSGVKSAKSVMFRSLDDFYSSISIERCLDDYAFLALQMNGEPLPGAHGFPARVMLPDLYGMKQPRWLKRIELQNMADTTSYWEKRGWAGEVPVKTMSRLDPPGPVKIGNEIGLTGVAYAGHRGVRAVEVSLDGGKHWQACQLQHADRPDVWSLWRYKWTRPTAGRHTLMVRATDGNGHVQTAKEHGSYPDGASGYDHLAVDVAKT